MKTKLVRVFLLFLTFFFLSSWSTPATTNQIQNAVRHEAIAFEPRAIPPSVVSILGEHRVVFLGEYHDVREHEQLIGDLAIALHSTGFRQVIIECNQAYDWMVEGYVLGELDDLNSQLDEMFGYSLRHIRAYNDTIPQSEKIHVRAGDVDYNAGAFYQSLELLARLTPNAQDINAFLASVSPAQRSHSRAAVQAFIRELQSGASAYHAAWGSRRYEQVLSMARVQLRSFDLQQLWVSDRDQALALREQALKTNVDEYLASYGAKTLINFGGKHIQRKQFVGEPIEWLGQYLSERSPYAARQTFLLFTVPYQGQRVVDGKVQAFNLSDSTVENELFRAMQSAAPGEASFLSLDDPLFSRTLVPIHYWSGLRMQYPKQYFDGYLVLPEAHPAISVN